MKKQSAVLIALAVGVAAVFGLVAATRTIHLGSAASKPTKIPDAQIAARNRALDRMEIALRKELGRKPPKLPALPAAASGAPAAASMISAPPAAPQAQRVIYVRPAPIIRHVARAGGHESEHEGDHQAAGGSHEGGGGFDD